MLYKFKSKDASDVLMLEVNGRKILEIIGKDAGPKGIILPEQMPAAIAALQAAMAHEESNDPDEGAVPGDGFSLRQRATPFLDMLRRSHENGHEMVWGV